MRKDRCPSHHELCRLDDGYLIAFIPQQDGYQGRPLVVLHTDCINLNPRARLRAQFAGAAEYLGQDEWQYGTNHSHDNGRIYYHQDFLRGWPGILFPVRGADGFPSAGPRLC
jgi:hypothetical protein